MMKVIQISDKYEEAWKKLYDDAQAAIESGSFDYEQVLDVFRYARDHLGEAHRNTADSLMQLSSADYRRGEFESTAEKIKQAVNIRCRIFGEDSPEVADAFNALTNLYIELGNYAEALDYAMKTLLIRRHHPGRDSSDLAVTLNNLGNVHYYLGDNLKAESFILEALQIREVNLGADHPDVANSLNNLAVVYHSMGNLPEALKCLSSSLRIRESYHDTYRVEIAETLSNLGSIHDELGNFDVALPLHLKALEIDSEVYGPENRVILNDLESLGNHFLAQQKYLQSRSYFLRALALREAMGQRFSPDVAPVLNALGEICFGLEEYREAEAYLGELFVIQEESMGPYHSDIETTAENMLFMYQQLGDEEKAKQMYEVLRTVLETKKKSILGHEC